MQGKAVQQGASWGWGTGMAATRISPTLRLRFRTPDSDLEVSDTGIPGSHFLCTVERFIAPSSGRM